MMKITQLFLYACLVAAAASAHPIASDLQRYLQVEAQLTPPSAQLQPIPFNRLTINASVSAIGAENRRQAAKFQEYRDIPNGLTSDFVADYWGEEYRFLGSMKNVGLDDQFFHFRAESFGNYRVDFTYDQIPHRFAFDGFSLFSGIGTGNLQVPDTLQSQFQGSSSELEVAQRLSAEFPNFSIFDSENLRKKAGVSFDFFAFHPWQMNAQVKHESRSGVRPFSGSFGFANLVELAMPTDYDTTEVRLGSEYTNESIYVGATYYASVFENNITALNFDNPFRISDSTFPEPVTIISNFFAGPAAGRIDLFPSNDYQNVSFTTAFQRLPWHSSFSALLSWGFLRQDDSLLPFSTNTAIVPGAANNPLFPAADPASLPVERVELKMNTPHLQLNFNTRPAERLQIKTSYRYYSLNNNPQRVFFPGFVRTDAEFRSRFTPGATFTNLPIEYDQNTFTVDFLYDVWKASQVSFRYTYDQTGRQFREVADLQEDRFRIAFDTRPIQWIDFRAMYERSDRTGDGYDFGQFQNNQGEQVVTALPFLRKFDQANRNRDRLQLTTNLYPSPVWTLSGSFIYGNDDFGDSPFGLLADKHNVYTLESSYALTERFDVNAFYSFETYKSNQKARSWLPMGPGDPFLVEPGLDSLSNWEADSEDDVHTFGAGFFAVVLPPRWSASLNVLYMKTDGQIQFDSPVGLFDLNPFDPGPLEEVDDVTRVSIMPEVRYIWQDDLTVSVGYWYDKYDIEDFNVNGFVPFAVTPQGVYNGALFMGTLPRDYRVNAVYVTVNFRL